MSKEHSTCVPLGATVKTSAGATGTATAYTNDGEVVVTFSDGSTWNHDPAQLEVRNA